MIMHGAQLWEKGVAKFQFYLSKALSGSSFRNLPCIRT